MTVNIRLDSQSDCLLLANCRITDYLIDHLAKLGPADQLEWLDCMYESVLHYSDFVKGMPPELAAGLYELKTKVSYFVPYLLSKVVDPSLKAEFRAICN